MGLTPVPSLPHPTLLPAKVLVENSSLAQQAAPEQGFFQQGGSCGGGGSWQPPLTLLGTPCLSSSPGPLASIGSLGRAGQPGELAQDVLANRI